jgi:hypothetical protein
MSEIRLYGNDHSPWVQAVMMGLHQQELDCSRSTIPSREAFLSWGVMMPAASFGGEPWKLESKDILHRLSFSPVSDKDMNAIRRTWQGVLHRADFWTRFWGEFSLAGDPSPSLPQRLINNYLRSFTILYFFLLIRFAMFLGRRKEPESYGDQYLEWEERFGTMKGPFLGGDAPDSIDLLLFGIIQCHCSIPVPPVTALQSDPRLVNTRDWIGKMQTYFAGYPSLYSGVYFEPHSSPPKPAGSLDQLAFWLGAISMIAFFWIAIPLVGLLAYRNRNLRG